MQDIEILLWDAFLFTFFIAVFSFNASVVNFTAVTCHVVQKKYKAHKMVAVGLSHLSSSDGSCDRIRVSRPFLSLGSLLFYLPRTLRPLWSSIEPTHPYS